MQRKKLVPILLSAVLLAQAAILWLQIGPGITRDARAAQEFTLETVRGVPEEYLEGRVLLNASELAELKETVPLLREIADQLRANGRELREIKKALLRIDRGIAEKQE